MTANARQGHETETTVLVLEDDPQLLSAMVRILTRAGYDVLTADSAAEAFQVAAAWPGPIHLLVCDLVLPGLGGREAATALQARRPELKVLYTSGYSSHGSFRRDVEDGGGSFIGKPFDVPELTGAVRAVLEGGTWPARGTEPEGER